jgi:hypothetical protein
MGTRRAVGAGSINGVSPLFFVAGKSRILKLRLITRIVQSVDSPRGCTQRADFRKFRSKWRENAKC